MRIFITGATGFIGTHLLNELSDHEVLCLTRSSNQSLCRNVRFLMGDLEAEESFYQEMAKFKPEVAIHLAWQGLPDYSQNTCETNLRMSRKLIGMLLKAECERIVVAGSCFEYGLAEGELHEESVLKPITHFSSAKVQMQSEFDSACRNSHVELVWSRIFYSYGPGQRLSSLLPSVCSSIARGQSPVVKTPSAIQDFVYVGDVATALAKLATTKSINGVFNIGSGVATSVAEFVNLIGKLYPSKFEILVPDEPRGSWAAINKIRDEVSWRPKISLEEGIFRSIESLRDFKFV